VIQGHKMGATFCPAKGSQYRWRVRALFEVADTLF
jgi:hypothetical protein